jgi:hypothetical protein
MVQQDQDILTQYADETRNYIRRSTTSPVSPAVEQQMDFQDFQPAEQQMDFSDFQPAEQQMDFQDFQPAEQMDSNPSFRLITSLVFSLSITLSFSPLTL